MQAVKPCAVPGFQETNMFIHDLYVMFMHQLKIIVYTALNYCIISLSRVTQKIQPKTVSDSGISQGHPWLVHLGSYLSLKELYCIIEFN